MRYALYAIPAPDGALTAAATAWLGRDAFRGATGPLPAISGLSAGTIEAYLADPSRYGFHGTLKAPFALAEGRSERELIAAMDRFAANSAPIDIPELVIRKLGRFFAFVPGEPVRQLDDWAAAVVRTFEPFRAPLGAADIARRKVGGLTLAEERYLLQWGYPYVFDAFRFHMSLTGRVPKEDAERIEAALHAHFAAFDGRPFRVDRLALFVEPERGAPFTVCHSVLLG